MVNKNKVITNSTPIIGLSIINKLDLLSELFDEVFVPTAVYKEVVHSDSVRKYGSKELQTMIDSKCFKLCEVENKSLVKKLFGKLHEGQ